MNRLASIVIACAILGGPALAADMPTKAPNFAYPINSSGWYLGIDTGASVAKSNVSGSSNLFATALVNGDLYAAGGMVGGCYGYVSGTGSAWWGVHGCTDYQNITGSAPVAGANVGVASRWSSSLEFRLGGSVNPITAAVNLLPNLGLQGITFPTFTPPSVNGGLNLAAAPHTYLAGGAEAFGISGQFGQSGGASVGLAPMIKAGAVWQVLDANGKATGGAIDTYARVVFASKGITLDNVGGTNGQPVVHGVANLGTQYTAGVTYLFGVPSR